MENRSNKEKLKNRTDLATRIISAIVISFLAYGAVISLIGFCIFRNYFKDNNQILIYYIASILIAAIIFAVIESYLSSHYVKKQFVKPIDEISAEAVRFANENKVNEPLGDISSIDELSALAGALDTLEIKMTEYITI